MNPGRDEVAELVSRESLSRLDRYVALLRRWQTAHNLIAASTVDQIWERHVLDSLQLLPLLPEILRSAADLGAGAGFPALPVAICRGDLHMTAIESTARKAAFLKEAGRVTETALSIVCARAETLTSDAVGGRPEVILSRAAAPLSRIFDWSSGFADPRTVYLLHKGQDVDAELTDATKCWRFEVLRHPSRLRNGGWILEVRDVLRAP